MQGGGLSEFAEMRGISRNTAKWHLQAIFGKTDTSRQHELVSLVLRTAIEAGFP
ncbi:MAG: helix-turn-helix transcriptional regulator [Paracoccaceae bacterium]